MDDLSHIRNFSIIAHIDHGKSTIADRLIEFTQTVEQRKLREQMLDDMDLERERGITIKAHPVTMQYKARNRQIYQINLIDTPGHVDFAYEVQRSLASCEGALLVVDAAQGVEAQTVANTYLAMGEELTIVPVLNKIDLPNADVDTVSKQVEDILAIPMEDCLKVSAKTGEGIETLLEAIVARVPPPQRDTTHTLRALVFDSLYDAYRGVIAYVRVFDGQIQKDARIKLMASGEEYETKEVGIFTPDEEPISVLGAGEVGYVVANIKDAREIQIGDTITDPKRPASEALPGFAEVHPMVFAGVYPVDTSDYEKLRKSMEKLVLNDSSFHFQPESSVALGLGFRCGFLGLLHMEIVQERLRREYDLDIITTYPGVIYRVFDKAGVCLELDNPTHLPDPATIDRIEEPLIKAFIICLNEHIGDMMGLIMERRGLVAKTESIDRHRLMLTCTLPLNEILIDFHDKLKSISHGYSSMDYEYADYQQSDLVKLDILVHHEPVEAFSSVLHRSKAETRGRQICKTLRDLVPPQMFSVALQATIGGKVIARETIRAMRKDVTAKCYGGDITRKRKLLEKQKAGKKRMKQVGKVSIPQEAFISVLKQQS